MRHKVATIAVILSLILCFALMSCSTRVVKAVKVARYTGKEPLYSAVAYVMDLNSARLVKADIVNNDYITSYIKYALFGRVHRFRLYMSLQDQVFVTEIGDVQRQIMRAGFVSWESDDVSSLIDTEIYTQRVSVDVIRAAKSALFANFKARLEKDLEFNRIVLKDLPESYRAQWVDEKMKPHQYHFKSTIQRILKAKENRSYGRYLIKMSRKNADLKSHINLEFYSNNPSYTRYRIGDELSVTARLVDARYSNADDELTILLQDSQK